MLTPPPGLPDPGGRCQVWGVVNATPDSFSDGGCHLDPDAAVARGLALLADGADVVDVGGESTRPGAGRVEEAEELRRVLPVVTGLAAEGAVVSVDTTRRGVAEAALAAGACVVNDVSGGTADPDLLRLVADAGCAYVLMHGRGPSVDMQSRAVYADAVVDVAAELRQRLDAAVAAGVRPEQVVVDPGLGFAKTAAHNWALLAALPDLQEELGRPVLVGASRKGFLGALLDDRPAEERDAATVAVTALAAAAGAYAVRVHEAAGSADAVRVAAALAAAGRRRTGRHRA